LRLTETKQRLAGTLEVISGIEKQSFQASVPKLGLSAKGNTLLQLAVSKKSSGNTLSIR
jgi:hypothetical protein